MIFLLNFISKWHLRHLVLPIRIEKKVSFSVEISYNFNKLFFVWNESDTSNFVSIKWKSFFRISQVFIIIELSHGWVLNDDEAHLKLELQNISLLWFYRFFSTIFLENFLKRIRKKIILGQNNTHVNYCLIVGMISHSAGKNTKNWG